MAVTKALAFHSTVWNDTVDALSYYAGVEPYLSRRFALELLAVYEFIEQYPYTGRILYAQCRRMALRHFPYFVCYRVSGDEVQVLAIFHHRRDPAWVRKQLAERD